MRRYRFLLSPRWIGLIVAVAALVTICGFLADWQLSRNSERSTENSRIEAGLAADPSPLGDVLAPGQEVTAGDEWRTVTATGRYDPEHELFVRFRPLGGEPGFNVLTPLITEDGVALLVNRGWVGTVGRSTNRLPEVADPPSGPVTVTGRLRAAEGGDPAQVNPDTGQIRFIQPDPLRQWLPYELYDGYIELTAQDPAPSGGAADSAADGADGAPRVLPEPGLDPGPFLSYGVQWYLFGVIALIGLGILARDEAGEGKLRRRWSRGRRTTDRSRTTR